MVMFTLPTARGITQSWNMDFKVLKGVYYPNGFYASIGWLGHNGIDFGCPEGDDVEAVCDGVIEYVGPGNNHPLLSGGGNALLLRNDEIGIRFEYLHLNQQNVYTGQRVRRGQVIAQSGNTGISSGAHLHLGAIPVRPNLNNGYRGRVDPTGWLYGPSNPDYAGVAAQGIITPQPSQEDDMADSVDRIYAFTTTLFKQYHEASIAKIYDFTTTLFKQYHEASTNETRAAIRDAFKAYAVANPGPLDPEQLALAVAKQFEEIISAGIAAVDVPATINVPAIDVAKEA